VLHFLHFCQGIALPATLRMKTLHSHTELLALLRQLWEGPSMFVLLLSLSSSSVFDAQLPLQEALQFTGEEMYGRYLDLHEFYRTFVNLSQNPCGGRGSRRRKQSCANGSTNENTGSNAHTSDSDELPMDYGTYVQEFAHFHQLPRSMKYKREYLEYVEGLLRYLITFHERTIPLQSVMKLLGHVEDDFDAKWKAGEILGWDDRGEGALPLDADLVIDPEAFDSVQELLELGAPLMPAIAVSSCSNA
jgi:splicing factor 3A subunit 3